LSTVPVALHWDLNTESLKIDNDGKNDDGGNQVHNIGKTFTPESFTQSTAFIAPCEEEMEQGHYGTFEFGTTADVDGGRGKCLPDNRFTDVGGDEEIDARAKAVSFLEEFVKKDDDEGSNDELDDKKKTNTSADVFGLAVESCENVDCSLSERNDEGKN
jgi:hypothetical protein